MLKTGGQSRETYKIHAHNIPNCMKEVTWLSYV